MNLHKLIATVLYAVTSFMLITGNFRLRLNQRMKFSSTAVHVLEVPTSVHILHVFCFILLKMLAALTPRVRGKW